jgi:hypothetical protein
LTSTFSSHTNFCPIAGGIRPFSWISLYGPFSCKSHLNRMDLGIGSTCQETHQFFMVLGSELEAITQEWGDL